MKSRLLALFLAACPGALLGGDRVVKVFQGLFLPSLLSVDVGDTVTWTWVEGVHRLRSGASPQDPEAGKLFDVVLDQAHPSFSWYFGESGTISYFDEVSPDLQGSVAAVPFTVELEVVDQAFTPEEVTIFEGDAIHWVWIEGDHTITSGNGSEDPLVGRLFDAPSTSASPNFTFEFKESNTYPYFCRPHEHMGMRGIVFVERRFIRGDVGGDGDVDISDAVHILGVLFLGVEPGECTDAADANDDGQVDISDAVALLEYLFLGGREIPKPYPRPGADRTEDGLGCW